jgi:hypothetical protein
MATVENKHVRVYCELATVFAEQGQDQLRDRFLVLAADAAREFNLDAQAEELRVRLLEFNPHHLLKPFASFEEAMSADDVRSYVEGLRKKYPFEESEQLLNELRNERSRLGPGEPAMATPRDPTPPQDADDAPDFAATAREDGDEPPVFRFQDENESRKAREASPAVVPSSAEGDGPPETIPIRAEPFAMPACERPLDLRQRDEGLAFARSSGEMVGPIEASPGIVSLDGTADEPALGEEDLTAGAWVATTLLVVVVLAGVTLAVYTFAKPFLPELLAALGLGS